MSDERIRLEITVEAEQLRKELRVAAAEVKAFGAETEKSAKRVSAASADASKQMGLWRDQAGRWRNEAGQFASAAEKAAAGVDKTTAANRRSTSSLKELRKAVNDINRSFTVYRNLISTLKWPSIITGAGLAAQALNSLAAGGVAATSALAPLSGLAVSGAQGALAAGQAVGTWKLATTGLTEALGGNKKALAALTPEARSFLDVLEELQGDKKGLSRTAQAELFPGLKAGVEDARKNLPALNTVVGETAASMGHLAAQAGELVGSKGFGKDLATVGERNTRVIARAGRAGLDLTNVLRDLVVAAGPLTNWLSLATARWAHMVEQQTHAARSSGQLAHFFGETRVAAEHLASIVGSLAGGLWEVGKAAAPLGRDILADLDKTAQHWEDWTKSLQGQNELKAYFDQAKPTLYEMARLARDVVKGFLQLGNTPEMAGMIRQIRTELLPVLLDVVEKTTAAFGPALVDALVAVGKLLGDLAGSSGPLVIFVKTIGLGAEALHALLQDVPGLQTAVVTLAGAASVYKALQIGAAISGLGRIRGLLKAVKVEGAGAAAVGAAGGAAGATGGVAKAGLGARAVAAVGGPGMIAALAAAITLSLGQANKGKREQQTTQRTASFTAQFKGGDPHQIDVLSKAMDVLTNKKGALDRLGTSWEKFRKTNEAILAKAGISASTTTKDIESLSRAYDKLRQPTARVKAEVDNAAAAFADWRRTGSNNMRGIRSVVASNMATIKNHLGKDSAEGKDALAGNFRAARTAIRQAMEDGKISTKAGLAEIQKLMRRELAVYGITGKQATRHLNGQDTVTGKPLGGNSGQGAQRGLLQLGRPGDVGPDNIPLNVGGQKIIAAPGESIAIVNRHQRAVLDRRLADMGGLPGLFRHVNQEHMQGAARYARGGIVPLGRSLQRRGYQVGEHPAFGGVAPVHAHYGAADHYHGGALDINADGRPGGEAKWLDKLAAELKAAHWHVLWRVKDHFDHLHVDIGAGGGGGGALGGGAGAAMLKRVLAQGVGGTLKPIVQGGLDSVRKGAQAKLDALAGASLGEAGEPSPGLTGGLQEMVAQESKRRGWNAGDWSWIIGKESGGRAGAKNPTSTAFGIGQLLDTTQAKYGGGPGSSMQEQLLAMASYISDRYGDPTAAKAFWEQHNWYQRGGLVHAAVGHLAGGNRLDSAIGGLTGGGDLHPGRPHKPGKSPVGGRLKAKLKEIAEIARVNALGGQLERLRQTYSNVEREQGITQEQALKTTTVNGQDVEVRDEQQIAQHVAELDQLLGMQGHAGQLLGDQRAAATEGLRKIAAGITERVNAMAAIRERASQNIARIRALMAEVAAMDDAVRREKHAERRRKLRHAQGPRRHAIARELDGLRDQNQRLVGSRDGAGTGGRLGQVQGSLANFRTARDDLAPQITPVTGVIPQALEDVRLTMLEIGAERRTWTDTTPPAVDIPTASGADTGQVAELLRAQLDDTRRAQALSTGQFSALTGFAQLLGGRFVGSFAHGTMRVPETGLALIHKDERIVPDAEGPYGSQLAPGGGGGGGGSMQIEVVVRTAKGEVLDIVRTEVRKTAGQAASGQTGRRTRVLIAAPGGR